MQSADETALETAGWAVQSRALGDSDRTTKRIDSGRTPKHAFCGTSETIQPVTVEPLAQTDATGRFRGGGMLGVGCLTIICTLA